MPTRKHSEWLRQVEQVIRSRHYTRLAEGLAGEPMSDALEAVLTNVMHVCEQEGIDFESLVSRSQSRCAAESSQLENSTLRHVA